MSTEKQIVSTVDGEVITIIEGEHGLLATNAKPDTEGSWVATHDGDVTSYHYELNHE